MLIVKHKATGAVIEPGTRIANFRDEFATLYSAVRANVPGKDGKIAVIWERGGGIQELYAGVFDFYVANTEIPVAPATTHEAPNYGWVVEDAIYVRQLAVTTDLRTHVLVRSDDNTRAVMLTWSRSASAEDSSAWILSFNGEYIDVGDELPAYLGILDMASEAAGTEVFVTNEE